MSNLFNRIKNIIKNIDFKSKKTMLIIGLFLFTIASSVILISYGAYINSGSKNLVFGGTATLVQNGDVVLKIYEEDYYGGGGYIRRYEMPASYFTYNASLSYCTSGLTIDSFDTTNRTFDITATKRGYCKVYFDVNPSLAPNANFRLYVEQTEGTGDYQAMALLPTNKSYEINPDLTSCSDDNAKVSIVNSKINVKTSKDLDCDIYAAIKPEISQDFDFSSDVQTFTVPATGYYKLEVWGASGGNGYTSSGAIYAGGKGGYSYGTVLLNAGDTLYIHTGGAGTNGEASKLSAGGANGGGQSGYNYSGSGGGGTDIRINNDSLYARVIVAGGGGGGGYAYSSTYTAEGGAGGGIAGGDGINRYNATYAAKGGTQTAGGARGYYSSYYGNAGTFGVGGNANTTSSSYNRSGGGGGGWYGGGGGSYYNNSSYYYYAISGGGGGSGYVYTSDTASNYPSGCLLNSSYYMIDASLISGVDSFASPAGTSETGHDGNGYARITYIDN